MIEILTIPDARKVASLFDIPTSTTDSGELYLPTLGVLIINDLDDVTVWARAVELRCNHVIDLSMDGGSWLYEQLTAVTA